jgi:hypothetical protein
MFKKRSGCSRKRRLIHGKNPDVPKKKSGGPKTSGIQTKKIQRYRKILMFPKDPDVF